MVSIGCFHILKSNLQVEFSDCIQEFIDRYQSGGIFEVCLTPCLYHSVSLVAVSSRSNRELSQHYFSTLTLRSFPNPSLSLSVRIWDAAFREIEQLDLEYKCHSCPCFCQLLLLLPLKTFIKRQILVLYLLSFISNEKIFTQCICL